jgi:hypothetical protein
MRMIRTCLLPVAICALILGVVHVTLPNVAFSQSAENVRLTEDQLKMLIGGAPGDKYCALAVLGKLCNVVNSDCSKFTCVKVGDPCTLNNNPDTMQEAYVVFDCIADSGPVQCDPTKNTIFVKCLAASNCVCVENGGVQSCAQAATPSKIFCVQANPDCPNFACK